MLRVAGIVLLAWCVSCGGEVDRSETEWIDRKLELRMPVAADLVPAIGRSRQTLGPETPAIFDPGFAAKRDYDARPGGMAIVAFQFSGSGGDGEQRAQIEVRAWDRRTTSAAEKFWADHPPDVARARHPYPSDLGSADSRAVFDVSVPRFVDRSLGVCVEEVTELSEGCSEGYLWIAMCDLAVEIGYMADPPFLLSTPPVEALRGVTEILAQRLGCS